MSDTSKIKKEKRKYLQGINLTVLS